MRQSHLHLLGTDREDPLAHQRLQQALQAEKPDVITVDASPQLVEYIDSTWLSDSLKRLNFYQGLKPEVKNFCEHMIRNIYSCGVIVSRNYAQESKIPIHFVGDPQDFSVVKNSLTSPQQQNRVNQINKNQSMERLMKTAESKYKCFQAWFSNPDWASQLVMYDFVQRFLPDDPERESVTAENLTKLAYQVTGKIIHVGTLEVLTDDFRGQSLYERLRNLNPTRGTIADYV